MKTFCNDRATLYCGDNREVLETISDNTFDSIVTDPPYALNFMGKGWDTGAIVNDPLFWKECLRVLKPGGHMVAFGATRTNHRMVCAIEDAGFEIRDSLMWIYGSGFPKSYDVSKGIDKAERGVPHGGADPTSPNHGKYKGGCSEDNKAGQGFGAGPGQFMREQGVKVVRELSDTAREWKGWGTALKPAFEPIILARKPLSEKTVAANVLRWGTGALNIDSCRVNSGPVEKHVRTKNITDANSMAGVSTGSTGSGKFSEGRWPANIIHDGSDEVVSLFPNTKSGTGAVKGKTAKGNQGNAYGKESRAVGTPNIEYGDEGSAARFFYCPKATKKDRAESKHPTVKPIALMSYLVRLITPPNGHVLDPFAGSGTTGEAAINEGFLVSLIELEIEYQTDIERRLNNIDCNELQFGEIE